MDARAGEIGGGEARDAVETKEFVALPRHRSEVEKIEAEHATRSAAEGAVIFLR